MMATKRESSGKKTTKRKSATAAPELTNSAVIAVLESKQPLTSASASIDPDSRRRLVAAEAYFRAERRGFASGHELEDWVAAEAAVDSRAPAMQSA
jgi:Protein of unknown function (DUF2934)